MSNRRIIFGVLIILVGMSMLFDVNILRFFIPIVIIYFGVRLILGNDDSEKKSFEESSVVNENKIDRLVVFSGLNSKNVGKDFKGGNVVAIFGGGEIDLREAESSEEEIKLELVAVFGAIKIRVPKNWQVNSQGAGILGAFDNKAVLEGKAKAKLKVEGVAIFGGVEVTN